MKNIISQCLLVLVSIIARLQFIAYRLLVTALIAAMIMAPIYYWVTGASLPTLNGLNIPTPWIWGFGVFMILLMVLTTKAHPAKANPHRRYPGVDGWLNNQADIFIEWIGTLKYFTTPLSLVEDPGSYKIKGYEVRELISDGFLQPGDILLRGYDGYLDGIMISISGGSRGDKKKHFSHAALYLGDLNSSDKMIAARRLKVMDEAGTWRDATETEKDTIRNDDGYFQTGRDRVVHAMAKGVFVEDILTFTRCDYLIVLRLHDQIKLSPEEMQEDRSLINELPPDADRIRAMLMAGNPVNRSDVLEAVRLSALGKIGACYDFQFNDGNQHNRFSCSEFVYYCYKSIHCYLGLQLRYRAFAGLFFRRKTITPGDIYDAAVKHKKLTVIWESKSLSGA